MLTGLPGITWQHLRFVYKNLPVRRLHKIPAEDLEEEIMAAALVVVPAAPREEVRNSINLLHTKNAYTLHRRFFIIYNEALIIIYQYLIYNLFQLMQVKGLSQVTFGTGIAGQ